MLSAKCEYACVALVRLAAEHAARAPLQVRRLAAEEGVPEGFLVQILQELKRYGLVASTRGAAGGYRLARDPADVTLGEVVELFGGAAPCGTNLAATGPIAEAVSAAVEDAQRAARRRLDGVSLADLAERAGAGARMYYI